MKKFCEILLKLLKFELKIMIIFHSAHSIKRCLIHAKIIQSVTTTKIQQKLPRKSAVKMHIDDLQLYLKCYFPMELRTRLTTKNQLSRLLNNQCSKIG